jgi:hypothetical protein
MTIDDMTNASVAHFISLPAPNATAADQRALDARRKLREMEIDPD